MNPIDVVVARHGGMVPMNQISYIDIEPYQDEKDLWWFAVETSDGKSREIGGFKTEKIAEAWLLTHFAKVWV